MGNLLDTAVEAIVGKEQSPEEKDRSILESFDLKAQAESAKGILGEAWEFTKETTNNAFEWLKANKKDVIKVGLGIVGISLAYKLIRGLFGGNGKEESKKENGEGGGLFGWLKKAIGWKEIAGLTAAGSAFWLMRKIMSGDFESVINWFEGKAEALGLDKAKEKVVEMIGEKNAQILFNIVDAGLHPVEALGNTVDKAKAWCAEQGIPADWLPDPKKLYEEYIKENPTMATATLAVGTIFAWWFAKKGIGFLIGSVFKPKRILTLAAIGGLSMILFSDAEFIQNALKKIGIEDSDKDGKIDFSDIVIETGKKAIEAGEWLKGQIDTFLAKLGFSDHGSLIVTGTGALLLWKGRKLILGASKFAVPAATLLLIIMALWPIDEAFAKEKLETDEDKERFFKKYLQKVAQEINDPEAKALLNEKGDQVMEFLMHPENFAVQEQESGFNDVVECVNFAGDFMVAMGEEGASFLDALAENGDANQHTMDFVKEKNKTGFSLSDIVGLFEAMYQDGAEVLVAEDGISVVMKGARGAKWVLMTSFDTTIESVVDILSLHPIEGMETYAKGAAFFIAIGATKGAIFGDGLLKGAAKGAAFPTKVVLKTGKFGYQLAKTPGKVMATIESFPEWKYLKFNNVKNKIKSVRFVKFLDKLNEEAHFAFLQKCYKDAYRNYAFYSKLNPWSQEVDNSWSLAKSAEGWKHKANELEAAIKKHNLYQPNRDNNLIKNLAKEVLDDPQFQANFTKNAAKWRNLEMKKAFTQGSKTYRIASYLPDTDEVLLSEVGTARVSKVSVKTLPKGAFKDGKIKAVGKAVVDIGKKGVTEVTEAGKKVAQVSKDALEAAGKTRVGQVAQKAGRAIETGADAVASRTGVKAAAKFIEDTKIAKFAGKAVAPAFVAYDLYLAIQESSAAEQERNEAIKELKKGNARIHAGLAAINGGLLAAGAALGSASLAGVGAVAIESWRYIYDGAIESAEEHLKQAEDWMQERTRLELFHDLLSTATDLTTGDKYRAVYTTATGESILKEKIDTRRKIWEAIIMQEETVMAAKTGQPEPKNFFYRLLFIKSSTADYIGSDFDQIQDILKKSSYFAYAMAFRDKLITNGQDSYVCKLGGGTFDLVKDFNTSNQNNIITKIALWMESATKATQEAEGVATEEKEPELVNNPLIYALYEAGKYLGYTGDGSLKSLKEFFNEAHKGERGVYWNPEEKIWYLNEAGLEFDDKMGSGGYLTTINIIRGLTNKSDDVLEHRGQKVADAIMGDGYTDVLSKQTLLIRDRMQAGFDKWNARKEAKREAGIEERRRKNQG